MHIGNTINLPTREVHISPDDRRRHVYLVGMSGTGKSRLLNPADREDPIGFNPLQCSDPPAARWLQTAWYPPSATPSLIAGGRSRACGRGAAC